MRRPALAVRRRRRHRCVNPSLLFRFIPRSYFDYAASAPYWDSTVTNAGKVRLPLGRGGGGSGGWRSPNMASL